MTGRVVVITGSPGTGKTTVCASMARTSPKGVHVESDGFYSFVAQPISPLLPESHAQNETVSRAAARAAGAFAQGGYEVFLDGIFGPWFMPVVTAELHALGVPVEYVVLSCDLARAIERAGSRVKAPAGAELVRQMHAAFSRLEPYEAHAFDIGTRDLPAVLSELSRRRRNGEFRLPSVG